MFDRVTRCTGSLLKCEAGPPLAWWVRTNHRGCVGRLAAGFLLTLGLAVAAAAQTPVSSAFSYQGRISDASGPINGTADLIVTLFNAQSGGAAVGTANNLSNIAVSDGLFTTALDFGVDAVASDARWLEIAVRSPAGSGTYTTLTPRQPLTAAPVAWYAMRARDAERPWQLTAEDGYWLSLPTNVGQVNGVSIGAGNSPAARLHVRTGAFFPAEAMRIEDFFQRSQLRIATPESEGRVTLQAWNGQTNTAGPLSLNVGGGNVGIGTASPGSKLDVAGTVESDGFKLNGNGAAAGRVLTSDAAGVASWQAPASGSQWITNGSNIGYTAGNVGIGNTTPHASFRLQTTGGSGAWRGAIAATGTTNSAVMGEANGVATIGGHNAALSAWSNLSINPGGGNVGIGTTTPDMAVDLRLNDIVGSSATSVGQHDPTNRGTKVSFGHRVFGTTEFVGMRTLIGAGTNGCGNTADIRFDTWECGTSVSREVMRITGGGEVGIGTSTPTSKLDVAGMVTADDLTISSTNFTAALVESNNTLGTWLNLRNSSVGGRYWQLISTGSSNGQGAGKLLIGNGTSAGSHTNAITVEADGDVGIGTFAPAAKLDVIGTARVSVLQITGGSDVAEPFNINEGTEARRHEGTKVEPGMVVTIDPDRVGELRISGKAYDRTVAGIISGANGVNPGMVLTQAGSVADGKHPVALTGRVWCWCDADAAGPINAGDMLTTSDTPGHAMRVADHGQAAGAIIGKAMSSLKSGKGLVLVLVNLQ
jgi:hypothetical protein